MLRESVEIEFTHEGHFAYGDHIDDSLFNLPWYSSPKARNNWEDGEFETRHSSFGDLFSDLVFVGCIFNSGRFLADKLSFESFWVFFATLVCMYASWLARLRETSSLVANDYFHKFIHVCQSLTIALAASAISTPDAAMDYKSQSALLFTCFMLANFVLHSVIWIELWRSPDKDSRLIAWRHLAWNKCIQLPLLTAALVLILTEVDVNIVSLFWAMTLILPRIISVALLFPKNRIKRTGTLPMDIMYINQRLAQYTILSIGEGVLQIIIYDPIPYSGEFSFTEYIAQLTLSYCCLALLQLLQFGSLPWNILDHPLRKSKEAGTLWFESVGFYCVAQACVGIGLKLLLKQQYKISSYYVFFEVSVVCCLLFRLLQQLLHSQWHRHERDLTPHVVGGQIVFSFIPLAFAFIPIQPHFLLTINLVHFLLLFSWQVAHGRFKRKKKLNRVVAVILFIGKLKRRIRLRRQCLQDGDCSILESRIPSSAIIKKSKPGRFKRARKFIQSAVSDTNFYERPSIRTNWIQVYESHECGEIDWNDLFFDLAYVGVAYKINELWDRNHLTDTLLVEFLTFIPLIQCWNDKTIFQARYITADVYHKLLDAVQGCAVVLMASSIRKTWFSSTPYYPSLFVFSSSLILFLLVGCFFQIEIIFKYWNSRNRKDLHANPAAQAMQRLSQSVFLKLVPAIVSLHLVNTAAPIMLISLCWALGFFLEKIVLLLLTVSGVMTNVSSVPLDLHYYYHRIAEIAMIFIGEGILSLITFPIHTFGDSSVHQQYGSWILAFVILASIRQLLFSVERFENITQTAPRVSRVRGILYQFVMPLYLFGTCTIGGLGMISFVLDPSGNFQKINLEMEAYPFSFLGALFIVDMLHERDEWTFFETSSYRGKFYFLVSVLVKCYLVVQFALIGQLHAWPTYAIQLSQLFTIALMLTIHYIHSKWRFSYKQNSEPLRCKQQDDSAQTTQI